MFGSDQVMYKVPVEDAKTFLAAFGLAGVPIRVRQSTKSVPFIDKIPIWGA